jgi:hypothetical protein
MDIMEKSYYVQDSVLPAVSGNHWSSWNISSANKARLMYKNYLAIELSLDFPLVTLASCAHSYLPISPYQL